MGKYFGEFYSKFVTDTDICSVRIFRHIIDLCSNWFLLIVTLEMRKDNINCLFGEWGEGGGGA